jgi:predicted nucleic acid-binding Zn ribbon protein
MKNKKLSKSKRREKNNALVILGVCAGIIALIAVALLLAIIVGMALQL